MLDLFELQARAKFAREALQSLPRNCPAVVRGEAMRREAAARAAFAHAVAREVHAGRLVLPS